MVERQFFGRRPPAVDMTLRSTPIILRFDYPIEPGAAIVVFVFVAQNLIARLF
jgi:hypothetical protein